MRIDKPRSDDTIGGIDNALRVVGDLADFGDFPRRDGDIGAPLPSMTVPFLITRS